MKRKSILSLLVVIVFAASSLILSGFTADSSYASEFGEQKTISIVEEKIFSNATLNDDFSDDEFLSL